MPENACRWSVRGRLVDSAGAGVASEWVWLSHHDNQYSGSGRRTGPDGSFSFAVPQPGEYLIKTGDLNCPTYYSEDGGATFDRNEATLLSLGTQDVSGLVLRLPEDTCNGR